MVVIPAFQAQSTIRPLVEAIASQGLAVLVVDDASTDATGARAAKAGARVITRATNGGKGAALGEGFRVALQEGFDWILTMDADGQHLPEEIPNLLKPAREGQADLILGNRMGDPRGMPLIRRLTNGWMSWILSRMAGCWIPDTQCGFRAISQRVLKTISLNCSRFEIDSELVVKTAWAGFRIVSVPVSSIYRRKLSFIRPLKDTVRFFKLLRLLRRDSPARAGLHERKDR